MAFLLSPIAFHSPALPAHLPQPLTLTLTQPAAPSCFITYSTKPHCLTMGGQSKGIAPRPHYAMSQNDDCSFFSACVSAPICWWPTRHHKWTEINDQSFFVLVLLFWLGARWMMRASKELLYLFIYLFTYFSWLLNPAHILMLTHSLRGGRMHMWDSSAMLICRMVIVRLQLKDRASGMPLAFKDRLSFLVAKSHGHRCKCICKTCTEIFGSYLHRVLYINVIAISYRAFIRACYPTHFPTCLLKKSPVFPLLTPHGSLLYIVLCLCVLITQPKRN